MNVVNLCAFLTSVLGACQVEAQLAKERWDKQDSGRPRAPLPVTSQRTATMGEVDVKSNQSMGYYHEPHNLR